MLLTSMLLSLLACGDEKDDTATDTSSTDTSSEDSGTDTSTEDTGSEDTGSTGTASVRVLHLSPDGPDVDIFVDDAAEPAVTNLGIGESTPYVTLPAGTHRLRVAPEGEGASAAVIDVSPELAAGASYSAVAIGRVAAIEPLFLTDDTSGLASDKIRVQVVHAASAVGQVDIWNLTGGTASPLLENVDFGKHAVLPDLPAGVYRVGVDVDNDANPDVTFTLPNLPGGLFVNLFAFSDERDNVTLRAQLPNGMVETIPPDAAR
jgi:hypothetical protein